jgi:sigma-B regulation protein RsbU (phosphoserine phosphatase)
VLLYTDGVVEATDDANEMFGDERLHAALLAAGGAAAADILEAINTALAAFLGTCKCDDDVSIAVLRVI